MFKNYKDCLFNNANILRSQQRFKSDNQEVSQKNSIRLH